MIRGQKILSLKRFGKSIFPILGVTASKTSAIGGFRPIWNPLADVEGEGICFPIVGMKEQALVNPDKASD